MFIQGVPTLLQYGLCVVRCDYRVANGQTLRSVAVDYKERKNISFGKHEEGLKNIAYVGAA